MSDNNQQTIHKGSGSSMELFIVLIIAGALIVGAAFLIRSMGLESPQLIDSLGGSKSPLELNKQINELIILSRETIIHDLAFVNSIRLIVFISCFIAIVFAFLYILFLRKYRKNQPSTLTTIIVILILGLVPVILSGYFKIKEDRLLQTTAIVEKLYNKNTDPKIVNIGKDIEVKVPINIQSWFGYSEIYDFSFSYFKATLLDGTILQLNFEDPILKGGGRKPDRSDLLFVPELVHPWAILSIPSNPKLNGAIIEFAVSGKLGFLTGYSKTNCVHENFNTSTTFRIGSDEELKLGNEFSKISNKLSFNIYLSLIIGVFITIVIIIFTQRLQKPNLEQSATKV
jgi:hypothetical protein